MVYCTLYSITGKGWDCKHLKLLKYDDPKSYALYIII